MRREKPSGALLAHAERFDPFSGFGAAGAWVLVPDVVETFVLDAPSLVEIAGHVPFGQINAQARYNVGVFVDGVLRAFSRQTVAAAATSQTALLLPAVTVRREVPLAAGRHTIQLAGLQTDHAGVANDKGMQWFGDALVFGAIGAQAATDGGASGMFVKAQLVDGRARSARRRTVSSSGRVAVGEGASALLPPSKILGVAGTSADKPAVIHLTGHGADHSQGIAPTYTDLVLKALADDGYVVVSIDGGDTTGQSWAKASVATAIAAARTYAQAKLGARPGKVVMSGVSLGGLEALSFALLNPTLVQAVVGLIPVTDLLRHHDTNTPSYAKAEIEAAYATGVVASVIGNSTIEARNPRSHPEGFVGIPIKVWYGGADPTVPPAWTTDFVSAVNTAGGNAQAVNLGAGVVHDPTPTPPADVLAFVRQVAP